MINDPPIHSKDKVKQLSVEMLNMEKLFTQLFVPSVRPIVIAHNDRGPPPKKLKSNKTFFMMHETSKW